MKYDCDVLVVGGGPAGLATAIAAQRRGLRAVVVEKHRPPIDKACGEGLMPAGVRALQQLGVELPPSCCMPLRGIRYLEGGRCLQAAFAHGHGMGVRRLLLQQALVRVAQEAGVGLRWQCPVECLHADGVGTSHGRLWARWVVGADGLHSRLRRWAGLQSRRAPRRGRRCFAVRRHYAVAPWSEFVEVHWATDFEAYVTPVAHDCVGVAFLCCGALRPIEPLLAALPRLQGQLAGAAVVSSDRGAGPLHQAVRAVTHGNLALVGDAAGYLDALTGEGLMLAFRQAEALATALASDDLPAYARAHRRIVRLPNLLTRAALLLRHAPSLRRALFALSTADATA